LYNNQLSGEIPPELGNLSNLQDLRLSNNQLSGPIPSQLGEIQSLQYLFLDHNRLIGTIPTTISNRTWAEFNLENLPYVASAIDNQQITKNTSVNLNLSSHFADLNNDSISYTASGLPNGLTLNATTGIITGQTSNTGTYTITVTGTDNDGSIQTHFDLNIIASRKQ
jgi:hypothetical protein